VALEMISRDKFMNIRATVAGRAALAAAQVASAPFEYVSRRMAATAFNRRFPSARVPSDQGYSLLPKGTLPNTDRVIDICRTLFAEKKAALDARVLSPEEQAKEQKKKAGFLRDLLEDADVLANPELVDFALSDPLLSMITGYLGVVPDLNRVDIVYSKPRLTPDQYIKSQLFHQDPEGLRQMKVFLYLFDVEEPNGPFFFIPAAESERIVTTVRRKRPPEKRDDTRFKDSEVEPEGGLAAAVRVRGEAGTAVLVDTSRCLHAGSRVQPGHFRACLFLQYCTSREGGQTFDARRFRSDPVRWLALRRHAFAAS
jgi:hypothetical protein